MGQKTHPIGLRVGLHRKWASSWYGTFNNKNSFDKSAVNPAFLSQGFISSRGGNYLSGLEDLIENLIKRSTVTKFSTARRVLPVDFRVFNGYAGHTYGFFFYTKLVGRR